MPLEEAGTTLQNPDLGVESEMLPWREDGVRAIRIPPGLLPGDTD